MRLVAARLIMNYDIKFAPGEGNGDTVELDLRDQLTARPGRLELVFDERDS